MIVIGVDPHKLTHTATAVESATNTDLASIRVEASLEEYRRLLRWAGSWPERTWAVENADGLGNHLAQWLVAAGETVLDVAASATARVRLSRGGRRKNDRIDAAAAACVAALQGDARRVAPDDASTSLRLLDERRTNVSSSRTRAVNQLHALLRELLAGGAPADLSAPKAAALLRTIRPATATARVRKQLAQELVADSRRYDTQLATNAEEMSRILDEHGTRLRKVAGVGPVMAARIVGRTGRASRFPTAAAFANYTGAAPVEVASADSCRHRVSRYGDRQLNSALHTIAVTQIRMPNSEGAITVVPTFTLEPFDGIGIQVCPCNIATTTPQAFTVASRPATSTGPRVPPTITPTAPPALL